MWFLGWCEANGGNISQRLEPDKMAGLPYRVGTELFLNKYLKHGFKLL